MCAGKYNIKMFTEDENLWDFHRGRQLEEEMRPKASEIAVLDKLAKMLRESKWRASSRSLYNTWFRTWMQFCKTNKQNPMKARPKWVGRYLTYLTVYYSVGTVQVAASALAAIYRLNGI
jgi:sulfur relay (sulfurtransferase) DsrC/TusE family protein